MVASTPLLAWTLGLAALAASIVAAVLLAQEFEQRDFKGRLARVMRPPTPEADKIILTRFRFFPNLLSRFGELAKRSAIFAKEDVLAVERALAAAGKDPRRAAAAFLGVKAGLLILLPLGGFLYAAASGHGMLASLKFVVGAAVAALFLPKLFLGFLARPFVRLLRTGLPDALDLLIVCVEAGLGLESAVQRVATELEPSNRPTALEFATLRQEMQMLGDRSEAFARMGHRTGLDGYRRLGTTLAQAIKHGTTLGRALRTLAVELRQEQMTRIEEKAARLPALLVLPLILFIMPALFIVLVAPSIIEINGKMGH